MLLAISYSTTKFKLHQQPDNLQSTRQIGDGGLNHNATKESCNNTRALLLRVATLLLVIGPVVLPLSLSTPKSRQVAMSSHPQQCHQSWSDKRQQKDRLGELPSGVVVL